MFKIEPFLPEIEKICRKYESKSLTLFGSALTEDFDPGSVIWISFLSLSALKMVLISILVSIQGSRIAMTHNIKACWLMNTTGSFSIGLNVRQFGAAVHDLDIPCVAEYAVSLLGSQFFDYAEPRQVSQRFVNRRRCKAGIFDQRT